jgi:hypothetical protein
MLFVLILSLAAAYGFGIGMAVVIWQMASEPCCTEACGAPPVTEEIEFKKSA